jgi:hypothetical protein
MSLCYRQANQSAAIRVKWTDQACIAIQMLIACWFPRQATSSANVNQATTALEKCAQVWDINLLKPTGYVMHQQFNIQQLYTLPTLYLCVLYLSENKQWVVPLTA